MGRMVDCPLSRQSHLLCRTGEARKRSRRRRQFGAHAHNWSSLGSEHGYHRLLVLHWGDLFSDEGLDTWQVRTSNVRTLLEEFVHATRVAEDHAPHRHALVDLIDEALNALERDEVVREHYPFLRAALQELGEKVGSGAPSLGDCRRRATVLLGRMRDYRDHALADLRSVGGTEALLP